MNRNEPVKHQVLTILRDCNGNVSFETLMESCGLSFVELSSMLGLLFKEKRIGVYVPRYVEGTNSRMPRKEELFKRFMELFPFTISVSAGWRSMRQNYAYARNI